MTSPAPSGPQPINVLRVQGTPLYLRVRELLAADIDPASGLVSALGWRNGDQRQSVYPVYENDGPSADRTVCPTPFVVVYAGGIRALDQFGREVDVVIEVHDDRDHGIQRWPGLVARIGWLMGRFIPPADETARYVGGTYFKSQSPDLPDDRYTTTLVQLIYAARVTDRTSGKGYQG